MSDLSSEKRLQLELRQYQRDQMSESILESMGLSDFSDSNGFVCESCDDEVTINDKPLVCSNCKGKGVIKPMFYEFECDHCFGTGYDMSNPVKIIKWQKLCMSWSKEKVTKLRSDLYTASTNKRERMGDCMDAFYKEAKLKNYKGD